MLATLVNEKSRSVLRIRPESLSRLFVLATDMCKLGDRVLGEFLKSRGDRRLIQSATVLLPSI